MSTTITPGGTFTLTTSLELSVPAVISMLHQAEEQNSATMMFRSEAVLVHTVRGTARANRVRSMVVVCWDDQLLAAKLAVSASGARNTEVFSAGARREEPLLRRITAARKFADGWRGGLGGACQFDLGFSARVVSQFATHTTGVLILPAENAFIDPILIDEVVRRHEEHPELDIVFTQAPPGLGALCLSCDALARLTKAGAHPGRLLSYQPDAPQHDPASSKSCVPIAASVARCLERYDLSTPQQIERLAGVSFGDAEQVVQQALPARQLPAEVMIELSSRRSSRPIFEPVAYTTLNRDDMTLELAEKIFRQLAGGTRVVFAGTGDPLLHTQFTQIINCAKRCGVDSIAVETDLLDLPAETLTTLTSGMIDVVAVHLPAATAETYQRAMGVNSLGLVLENLKKLCTSALAAGIPVVTPVFTKLSLNLEEMEAFYDHFIRTLGAAVVRGPSNCAGQLPDVAAIDMTPPKRVPCRRLASRMTVWSDGTVPLCENDIHGSVALGHVARESIATIWGKAFHPVRQAHTTGSSLPLLCQTCNDWDRP